MNETFIFYKYDESFNFVWQFYDKFDFFEFPKVVRQHTLGVVGNNMSFYWTFPSLSSGEGI